MSGKELADLLESQGFSFFTGVPCSLIESLITALERHPRLPYVAAVREDAAVGVAGGAWFTGKKPAVLMQNSGLGTSLNALASFSLMYGIPALLLVTWRGYQGKDAPEHALTGEISPRLLELLGIPCRIPSRDSLAGDVVWAAREMDVRQAPVALLIPPKVVDIEPTPPEEGGGPATDNDDDEVPPFEARAPLVPEVSRREALAAAVKQLGDEPVVHANGYICRESFSVADRPQNFYMIGSMGLASAIGLGLALGDPGRRAVVFDGDGNLLMNLGVLAMVGSLRPPNFAHLVFDNEVYGSTGNQRSLSREVRLDRVARGAGYRTVAAVTGPDAVADAVRRALTTDGPHFVLAKVTSEDAEVPRIPHAPGAIRDRFRRSLMRR